MRAVQNIKESVIHLLDIITGVTTHRDIAEHINKVTKNLNDLAIDVSDIPDEIEKRINNHKPKISFSRIDITNKLEEVKGEVTNIDDTYLISITVPYNDLVNSAVSISSIDVDQKYLDGEKSTVTFNLTNNDSKTVEIYNGHSGSNGLDGVSIKEINQKKTSTQSSGENIIEIILTDGTKKEFSIYNGAKGDDGENGSSSETITPKFKIQDGNLYISFTDGTSWENLGKVKGDTGNTGPNGIGIQNVEQTESSTTSGGRNTITVTTTDNKEYKFYVYNGQKGDSGTSGSDANITIDSELNNSSTNPVENRAIKSELDKKLNTSEFNSFKSTVYTKNETDSQIDNKIKNQSFKTIQGNIIRGTGNVTIFEMIDLKFNYATKKVDGITIHNNAVDLHKNLVNGIPVYLKISTHSGSDAPTIDFTYLKFGNIIINHGLTSVLKGDFIYIDTMISTMDKTDYMVRIGMYGNGEFFVYGQEDIDTGTTGDSFDDIEEDDSKPWIDGEVEPEPGGGLEKN